MLKFHHILQISKNAAEYFEYCSICFQKSASIQLRASSDKCAVRVGLVLAVPWNLLVADLGEGGGGGGAQGEIGGGIGCRLHRQTERRGGIE